VFLGVESYSCTPLSTRNVIQGVQTRSSLTFRHQGKRAVRRRECSRPPMHYIGRPRAKKQNTTFPST